MTMTAIRYDIITGNYYSAEKGAMLYPNGFPDGVLNVDGDDKLKEHCDKNLVKYPMECETTGKFLWNGITYYASAKTLQQIEKKFKIDEVFTDKDLKKKEEEKADKLRKLMATEEWLENKVLEDSAAKFSSGIKRNEFVQTMRDLNPEIAQARMTRVTQKYLNEGYWVPDERGCIKPGPKFPKEKLPKKEKGPDEEKNLFGRKRKRR
jgi:hypothetical protein